MKIILFFVFILGLNTALIAQNNLHVFQEFKHAYQQGTRSKDGKPGPKYWQNSADYDMTAIVYPSKNRLKGKAHISYHNNSPDSLNSIVFKVYQNLFEKGRKRDNVLAASDIHNGMIIDYLKIRSETVDQINSEIYKPDGTILTVALDEPLLPGDSLSVNVRWSFHIPEKTVLRMGKRDSTSFFIGYWYPKIAVYDDIHGWDKSKYTGQQEFYNNYGDYDVKIHIPSGYGVWATGLLENPKEVYNDNFVSRMNQAFASDSVTHLITAKDYTTDSVPFDQSSQTNAWQFSAQRVPEFAFAFGNHYLWDATGLDVGGGRRISISAVYLKSSEHFNEVAKLARETIQYFFHRLPGVPFPFPKMTVVNGKKVGAGGMEYPMIVNNPTAPFRGRRVDVTSHEIAHTYFPMYVGTNEHDYAWMDEGWASMLPADYMKETEPSLNRLTQFARESSRQAGYTIKNLPMMVPSTTLTNGNYSYLSYGKPAMAYNFLREELGDRRFKNALRGYINRWKYKHPTPYDFFYSFNDLSGQNLNWFWESWFFDLDRPNLSIADVERVEDGYKIHIANKGGVPLPVAVKLMYDDGRTRTVKKTMGVWKNRSRPVVIKAKNNLKKVTLGNDYIPDISRGDNVWQVKN